MTKTTLTRAELHALLWAHPPNEVAEQLGITARELDHLLALMATPYPYSGYWSLVEAVARRPPKLPKAPPGAADSVQITPVVRKPEAPTHRPTAPDGVPENSTPQEPSAGNSKDATEPDQIPTRLRNPHRIVAARIAEEQRSRTEWRRLGVGGTNTAQTVIERRQRIIDDLLFKAVERRGHKVEVESQSIYQVRFLVTARHITYAIRERYRQQRERLSREEALESWNVAMNRTHKQVRVMTGRLALTLDGGVWPKPQWEDKPGRPLELQIEDIVDGLESVASKAAARDDERRAEQRRYDEEQERREAARARVVEDESRWRKFRELAAQAHEARQVRSLIAFLEAELATPPDKAKADEFLAWARKRLETFDPLTRGAEAIIGSVQAVTARSYSD